MKLLGKTFLKKGYSPNPFPKTFNVFGRGVSVFPKMQRTVALVCFSCTGYPSPKNIKSFREGVWGMTLFQKGLPQQLRILLYPKAKGMGAE
jgi:hypothetical protein